MVGIAVFALCSALNVLAAAATDVPQIEHPVTDLAGALSPDAEETIARELVEHQRATGVQLAVLLVDTTHGRDISDYAQAVFTRWGGGSRARNDGALFVLAIADRRSRLQLGYGLEPLIPDAVAKRMLDDLRPSLISQDYARATLQLVHAVRKRTDHLTPGDPLEPPLGSWRWMWLVVIAFGIALGIAWAFGFRRGWRAYDAHPQASGYHRKPRSERFATACAFLIRQRPVQIALGAVVLAQVALVYTLSAGHGYVTPYTITFWHFLLVGWLLSALPWMATIVMGVIIGAFGIPIAVAVTTMNASYGEPADVYGPVGALAGAFWVFGLMIIPAALSKGGGGGSGYSSSYSYSSDSSSSSSYSYSSSSSSSSYSSSDYSGGGGSSGGGGASSSW